MISQSVTHPKYFMRRCMLVFMLSGLTGTGFGESEFNKNKVFIHKPSLSHSVATLVLCPGQNGSSEEAINNKAWTQFAEQEHLALVGYHFESPDSLLEAGKGYFVAERGSGKALLQGIEKADLANEPLFLYGFSGGAHFAMSFAAWAPEKIAGFCAYSFAWSSPPPQTLRCPALIVCGEADGKRYASTLQYFQEGRRQRNPWTWISLGGQEHAPSSELDAFVREYLACLTRKNRHPVIVDNITKQRVKQGDSDIRYSVLPSESLLASWRQLHHP